MKLQNIFEDILNEATPEQIYKKYYSNIDYKIFLDIIEADPKTKISGNHILRIGPYSKILINIYNTGNLNMEDLPKATDYLEVVYKYNIPLNNNEIKSIGDIYEKVKTKMFVSNQSVNDVFNLLQPDEYKLILNSEKWLLLIPISERAACYLGINTQWCTTWGKYSLNPSNKTKTSHFKTYTKDGPLYIIINKEDPTIKYQIHIETNQFKNPSDSEVKDREQIFETMPEIKNTLFPFLNTPISKKNIDDIINQALKVSEFLPKLYLNKIFTNATELGILKNQFLISIISDNDISQFITDPNIITNDDERYPTILKYKNIPYVEDYYSQLYCLINKNNDYDEPIENESKTALKEYIQKYYDDEKYRLIKDFGDIAKSFDTFEKYVSNFYYEKIYDRYDELYQKKYNEQYNDDIRNKHSKCTDIVNVDNYKIHFNKISLATFIHKFDIKIIEDFNSFFEDFIMYNNIEDLCNYEPTFAIEDVPYEDIKDDIDYLISEYDHECRKDFENTFMIVNKFFKNNAFDNDMVYVKLEDDWAKTFDCEQGIYITFKNKQNNADFTGFVKPDNLIKYVTIQPLNLKEDILKQFKRFL